MARPKATQTTHRVSMEDACSIDSYRKAIAANNKTARVAMREILKEQKITGTKKQMVAGLKKTAANGRNRIPKTALRNPNQTLLGMDLTPESLKAKIGPR